MKCRELPVCLAVISDVIEPVLTWALPESTSIPSSRITSVVGRVAALAAPSFPHAPTAPCLNVQRSFVTVASRPCPVGRVAAGPIIKATARMAVPHAVNLGIQIPSGLQ